MTSLLHAHIIDRLPDSGAEGDDWALLVVAALDGADALEQYLGGRVAPSRRPPPPARRPGPAPEPPGVYVQSIAVEGFRGIGPKATLTLTPGPGLTLVVGRNGCGKSSFAEGLEMLLTGANHRWGAKRAKVWLGGWRNLHHGTPVLRADLIVEGQGPVAITRTWPGDDVQQSAAVARVPGKGDGTLESLGWSAALGTFRPFLSYNELGSLLEDGPSRLYDALSSVLGLDDLTRVQEVLAEARKSRTAVQKQAADTAKAIAASIEALDVSSGDARPAAALRALRARVWDLGALEALVASASADAAAGLDLLRRLQSLPRPDVKRVGEAVQRLRAVEAACAAFAGTDAERSRQCALLLRQALDFHRQHDGTTCPVCGTVGVLGAGWSLDTTAEIARLEHEAAAVDAAERDRQRAVAEARSLVAPLPRELAQAAEAVSLDSLPAVRAAWGAWAGAREITSAAALADHLEAGVLALDEAVGALIDEAGVEATRREDTWRPVHRAIVEWLPRARLALDATAHLATLKKAEEWMKSTGDTLRAERFRPIADKAIAVWQQLRLQSNVDLGNIELEGRGTRRAVALAVTVDGIPAGDALHVMSQGELHSLALSLFLPRATLPESPFRFIAVDDPVQSMDPTRVEGLARALADTARTRQVIVFTHDDRLPEACRRLGLAATVIGVTRRAGSLVETRAQLDPVSAYLDDARAVVKTKELPAEVVQRVVPGFCRNALEAACMERVRRVRLKRGELHVDIERMLLDHAKLYPLLALAFFDDAGRAGEVLARANNVVGSGAALSGAAIVKACNAGAHEPQAEDPALILKGAEKLAKHILGMPA